MNKSLEILSSSHASNNMPRCLQQTHKQMHAPKVCTLTKFSRLNLLLCVDQCRCCGCSRLPPHWSRTQRYRWPSRRCRLRGYRLHGAFNNSTLCTDSRRCNWTCRNFTVRRATLIGIDDFSRWVLIENLTRGPVPILKDVHTTLRVNNTLWRRYIIGNIRSRTLSGGRYHTGIGCGPNFIPCRRSLRASSALGHRSY